MSLHHIRERARWMQKELRTLPPDRPATVQDLIEVFTAIEELAREAEHRDRSPAVHAEHARSMIELLAFTDDHPALTVSITMVFCTLVITLFLTP